MYLYIIPYWENRCNSNFQKIKKFLLCINKDNDIMLSKQNCPIDNLIPIGQKIKVGDFYVT